MTPGAILNGDRRDMNRRGIKIQEHQSLKDRDRRFSNDDDRYGSSFRDSNNDDSRRNRPLPSPPPPSIIIMKRTSWLPILSAMAVAVPGALGWGAVGKRDHLFDAQPTDKAVL